MELERLEQNTSNEYVKRTRLLDYDDPSIQQLVQKRGWNNLSDQTKLIGMVYAFVRDEIAYGYEKSYSLTASQTLGAKRGNCMTKTTLLMALLRAVGIPCCFHATLVNKIILRGLAKGLAYKFIPEQLPHGWVEIFHKGNWLELEGHIIDKAYLQKLQAKFPDYMGSFYGFGIAVLNFKNPPNRWDEENTYVQDKAVEDDLGKFYSPDDFFRECPEAEQSIHRIRFNKYLIPAINSNINAIRGCQQ